MEVSIETLRTTIGAMSDEELLKRWGSDLFTEAAHGVAEAEIKKRGLDTSFASIEAVRTEERDNIHLFRSGRYIKFLASFMVAAGCGGFARLGVFPVIVVGLATWPIAKWIATQIDSRAITFASRFILGVVAFIATLLISSVLGILASSLLKTGVQEKDSETIVAFRPAAAIASSPASAPTARIAAVRPALTEYDLRAMAETQNKALPIKTSENLELTRIEAGPGMQLTYQARVLADSVSKGSFSDADIAIIRSDAIKEGCVELRAGLESGVTYVMAYNATDGTNLFSFPIVFTDC